MNQLLILKHALPGEELKITTDCNLHTIQYGKIKKISTDGIDNGIINLLKLVEHNIFDANLYSYHRFITNSITLLYVGTIPSLQFLQENNIKLMISPTGIDYETEEGILAEDYMYAKYEDINFTDFAYIVRLKVNKGQLILEGKMKNI